MTHEEKVKLLGEVIGQSRAWCCSISDGKDISREEVADRLGVEGYYSTTYGKREFGLVAVGRNDYGFYLLPYTLQWSNASGGRGEENPDVDLQKVADEAVCAVEFHHCDWENVSRAIFRKVV